MSKPILDVTVQQQDGISVAVIQGPVDSATIEEFKQRLDPLCLPQGARVVLDCRGLTYMNSRAIGLIMKYQRAVTMGRGRLVLCCLNAKLVRTFDLLQLGKSLVIVATREEALAAVR